MKTAHGHGLLVLTLAFAGCRGDSPGTPTQPAPPGLVASRHEADDPPQFSAWSTPVNLGPPVNTAFVDQGASISRDGLRLYFQCRDCPGNVPGSVAASSDIYVSQRASVEAPWGTPQRLGP